MAYHVQEDDGLALFVNIGGYGGSSTRTELAAGIVAISAHGPVHLGSDSRAFVDKANKIRKDIIKGKRLKKPWGLQSDGDLWEHFYFALCAKGTSSFKVSWVKGHAKDIHIRKGITTTDNKIGNDKADSTADKGTLVYGERLIAIGHYLHKRHCAYLAFMKDVATHIVEGYLIHRHLTERAEDTAERLRGGQPERVQTEPLWYPSEEESRKIQPSASIANYAGYCGKHQNAIAYERFLSQLSVCVCDQGQRAITWIELYIYYCLIGYPKPIDGNNSSAVTRPTADKQIREFKRALKAVAARTIDSCEDEKLFKASTSKKDVLKSNGILGKHPCLSFNICITDIHKAQIARKLISINHKLNNKDMELVLKGERKIIPRPLKLKGKTEWDNKIAIPKEFGAGDTGWQILHKPDLRARKQDITFLKCPKCNKQASSGEPAFQRDDLDRASRCIFCRKSSPVGKWLCNCDIQWHNCDTHKNNYKDIIQIPKHSF